MSDKPNPGSDEALSMGCKCPVLDNGHGRGSGRVNGKGKPLFWFSKLCPLHNKSMQNPTSDKPEEANDE